MKNKFYRLLQLLFILLSIISCAKKGDHVQPISKDNQNSCEIKLLHLIKESDFHANEIDYFVRAEEVRNDTIIIKAFVENNLSDNKKNKEIVESVVSWFIIPPQHDGVYLSLNALDPLDPKFKKLKIKENLLNEFLSCYLKNVTPNPPKKNMEFENLFNESSVVKFTPKDLDSKTTDYKIFKNNLTLYEKQHPLAKDFKIDNLKNLINNETFTNNERYVDSSWVEYFINKYEIPTNKLYELLDLSIDKEDFEAVKILIKHGCIISRKQINDAELSLKYFKSLNGKIDPEEFYDPAYSKISEIEPYLKFSFSKNKISDPDGYTNLRKDKNTSSEVLQKVKSGEHIEVLDNSGDWFLVKTKEGKEGYIHQSRIKSE